MSGVCGCTPVVTSKFRFEWSILLALLFYTSPSWTWHCNEFTIRLLIHAWQKSSTGVIIFVDRKYTQINAYLLQVSKLLAKSCKNNNWSYRVHQDIKFELVNNFSDVKNHIQMFAFVISSCSSSFKVWSKIAVPQIDHVRHWKIAIDMEN